MATKSIAQLHAELGIPANYGRVRGLRPQREARRLVAIARNAEGRRIWLTPAAATAWKRMSTAAALHGITLLPLSGFRSVRRQTTIVRGKLRAGVNIAAILRIVAAPGFSEHHTGRAIDIGSPDDCSLDETFARTAAFRWLKRRAGEFGFSLSYPRRNRHGIAYEPWHWCWSRR